MDRRRFLRTSLVGALAAPLGAEPQPMVQVYRVGLVGITRRLTMPSRSPAHGCSLGASALRGLGLSGVDGVWVAA
ncbi:MAG: hypothetical protein C5B48_10670 [Candidatus Rokuibacteriota bacterium]|nr:MAG: hypothetical protein C5B48_10670 [Candidatus Rokubacteria bacterium]